MPEPMTRAPTCGLAGAGATWLSGHPAHPSRIEAVEKRFEGVANAATLPAAKGGDQADNELSDS